MSTGICGFREALDGIPGAHELLMRYENGRAVQAFFIGDVIVRVGAMASHQEVREAFLTELEKRAAG